MKVVYPDPRFAVLLSRVRPSGNENGDDIVECEWHYNHRMYLSAPTAKSMPTQRLGRLGNRERRVIRIDPELCEPDGLLPQDEYEFCERMTDYWANRTVEAMKKAQGTDFAQPRPKRTRGKKSGTAKRKRRTNAKLGNLAKQALVMGAASAIGTIIGNAFSNPNKPKPDVTEPFDNFLLQASTLKGPSDGG